MAETALDLDFCRGWFPQIVPERAYFENAGGSYVPSQVIDALTAFMRECQCQPGWDFAPSRSATERLAQARGLMAEAINAGADEIVVGPSTTLNVYVLAQALRPLFRAGDEIVVTNQDHEANSGAWRRLADTGMVIREWRIDPETGDLDPAALDPLLGPRTRLVAFPHVSNIVGSVNDVKAITAKVHRAGAMVCVDGVATVAHLLPDVKALDADFYLFSLYKFYGPHLALLYGKRERIADARNQNHFFHEGNVPATLNPGGLNYESTAALVGIAAYFEALHDRHFGAEANSFRARLDKVYGLFRAHEAALMARFLDYLGGREDIRLVGRAEPDPARRAPTFSLAVAGRRPADVAAGLAARGIAVGHGHFYGYRCVEALGIDPAEGVLRVSMVHYNTVGEVDRLIAALEELR